MNLATNLRVSSSTVPNRQTQDVKLNVWGSISTRCVTILQFDVVPRGNLTVKSGAFAL